MVHLISIRVGYYIHSLSPRFTTGFRAYAGCSFFLCRHATDVTQREAICDKLLAQPASVVLARLSLTLSGALELSPLDGAWVE